MPKTLMISNDAYTELKKIKHDRSFSKVILSLLHPKPKTGADLLECRGLIKDDAWPHKELKRGWDKWNKRYA